MVGSIILKFGLKNMGHRSLSGYGFRSIWFLDLDRKIWNTFKWVWIPEYLGSALYEIYTGFEACVDKNMAAT